MGLKQAYSYNNSKKKNKDIFSQNRKKIRTSGVNKNKILNKDYTAHFQQAEVNLKEAIKKNLKEKVYKEINLLKIIFSSNNDPKQLPFNEFFCTKLFDAIVSLGKIKFMGDAELVNETFL